MPKPTVSAVTITVKTFKVIPTCHIVAIIQTMAKIVGIVAIKLNSRLRYIKVKTTAAKTIESRVELIWVDCISLTVTNRHQLT